MQKRSEEDNTDDIMLGGDITSQRIQYPPPCQQFTGQYQTVQNNGFVQNYDSGHLAQAPAPQVFYPQPQHPTAQQHYALHHQLPMQQQPQQMYYQPFPQQHQNPSLVDVNSTIHQLASAFVVANSNNTSYVQPTTATAQNQSNLNMKQNQAPPNQITANTSFVPQRLIQPARAQNQINANLKRNPPPPNQIPANNNAYRRIIQRTVPPATAQNQSTANLKHNQPPPSRMINFDHVEKPIPGPDSHWLHQKTQPANNRTDRPREEMITLLDCKEDTSQRGQMKDGKVADSEQKIKQRRSNTTKRQKQSKIKRTVHNEAAPVFKRKEPPELQNAELKGGSKSTKKQRQSDTKQEKQKKIDRIHPTDPRLCSTEEPEHELLFAKGRPDKPSSKTKKRPSSEEPATDNMLNVSIVVPQDEHLVNPYIVTVLRQYKHCALEKMLKRHQQGLSLECIHCAGSNSRKFSSSNAKNMSGNLNKFCDHLLTCSDVPDALKESIEKMKYEHKNVPSQGRQSFFDGIFDRFLRDNKLDEICNDSKKKSVFENDDKNNGICGGNKNRKKHAKPSGSLTAQKALNGSKENPLVLEKDEHLVDAFLVFVMRQYKRCTLDANQRSHHDVGFPGLECIHCTGHKKVFYGDAKSIRSNFSHLSSHLSECRGASSTLKEALSKLQEGRRPNKKSDSASFFNNIWSRLHGDSCANEKGAGVIKQVESARKTTIGPTESSLVLVEDRKLVNDFVFTLMSQFRRCELDLLAKNKSGSQMKFDHGHPGLECIHCAGPKSRKFFYSSSDLLSKNFSQLYNHFLSCGSVPEELKKSLEKFKNEQKLNKQGCRASFFNAVWARLLREYDAEPEKKTSLIKSEADEKTVKQQRSNRACDECRRRRTKCDGKQLYCLYNAGSMATENGSDKHKAVSKRQPNAKKPREEFLSETTAAEDTFLCKVISQDSTQIFYPHAPMGQLWLNKSFAGSRSQSDLSDETSIDINASGTLIGRRYVWDEGYFVDQHHDVQKKPAKRAQPILRGCTCGADHSYIMGAGMENDTEGMKSRRSERSGGSMRTSTVLSKLADGTLSPHTLIYPDEYTIGPELRFRKNSLAENVQPFSIRVSPDALFLADLHAHLSDSEIIGFLGGHYSPSEKCIYIQAAFPCKATDRADDGDTDVEMDPVSQIYAREAISNHGLSVVGWYHSHPTFQPNPSVTDIENQASYQQLFQGDNEKDDDGGDDDDASTSAAASPFVGLIIGTYDGQNPTSESVMRWFHVISKKAEGKDVNYPMQLKTTHRHFRVLDDELRPAMTSQGAIIRQGLESKYLSCPITKRAHPSHIDISELDANTHSAASSTTMAEETTQKKKPDDDKDIRVPYSSITENVKDHEVTIIENDQPALLLSESLFEQPRQGNGTISWKFKSAIPLYFTDTEKKILQMDADTIPNDVLAGIIWFAVEREQRHPAMKSDSLLPASIAPSSRAILELLLRLSFTGTDDMQRRLYEIIHSLESESKQDTSSDEMSFNDIDAVISHKVDAVLSHYYSSKQKKVNPFKSWSGAGDKGKNIDTEKDEAGVPPLSSTTGAQCSWVHYYLTEVLRMSYDEVGDRRVYRGGSKMQRGQKIAACLLKWARRMQLRPDFEAVMSHKSCNEGDLKFDSETSIQQVAPIKNGYIFVVAEVMRLLAARWSEAAGNPPRQKRQR
ncbi:hypothetical protein ACHAWT_006335 [Skeletonema menzelii]